MSHGQTRQHPDYTGLLNQLASQDSLELYFLVETLVKIDSNSGVYPDFLAAINDHPTITNWMAQCKLGIADYRFLIEIAHKLWSPQAQPPQAPTRQPLVRSFSPADYLLIGVLIALLFGAVGLLLTMGIIKIDSPIVIAVEPTIVVMEGELELLATPVSRVFATGTSAPVNTLEPEATEEPTEESTTSTSSPCDDQASNECFVFNQLYSHGKTWEEVDPKTNRALGPLWVNRLKREMSRAEVISNMDYLYKQQREKDQQTTPTRSWPTATLPPGLDVEVDNQGTPVVRIAAATPSAAENSCDWLCQAGNTLGSIFANKKNVSVTPQSSSTRVLTSKPLILTTTPSVAKKTSVVKKKCQQTISGFVFVDNNGNKIKDPGEKAVSGFTLFLEDGEKVQQFVTNEFGGYSFEAELGKRLKLNDVPVFVGSCLEFKYDIAVSALPAFTPTRTLTTLPSRTFTPPVTKIFVPTVTKTSMETNTSTPTKTETPRPTPTAAPNACLFEVDWSNGFVNILNGRDMVTFSLTKKTNYVWGRPPAPPNYFVWDEQLQVWLDKDDAPRCEDYQERGERPRAQY